MCVSFSLFSFPLSPLYLSLCSPVPNRLKTQTCRLPSVSQVSSPVRTLSRRLRCVVVCSIHTRLVLRCASNVYLCRPRRGCVLVYSLYCLLSRFCLCVFSFFSVHVTPFIVVIVVFLSMCPFRLINFSSLPSFPICENYSPDRPLWSSSKPHLFRFTRLLGVYGVKTFALPITISDRAAKPPKSKLSSKLTLSNEACRTMLCTRKKCILPLATHLHTFAR